ncbi:hypothetical protein MiTs_03373 [Microcystis aeruginosa NIES-2521]|uniref:H repeat-associated protein N-terminal domain-containing protein n=1 Tax=Microcystis aeruginosa NIES-2521 TaxID=2303983 RepID=A0A5A5S217_MICAE|nr:hypothetical protein MiTs_03373 [Microcystis aeruginosa NIES-2521]
MLSLIEKLKQVNDFRKYKGKRHSLWLVLLVIILPTFRTSLSSIVVVCKFIVKGTHSGNKHPYLALLDFV